MKRSMLSGTLVFITQCAIITNQEQVEDAAHRELQCPRDQVSIHHDEANPNQKTAHGCGKVARFNRNCRNDGYCAWKIEGSPLPAK